MRKEHLTKLLEKGVVVSPLERQLYIPHKEQAREPLTVHFAVKFNGDGRVISVHRKCNLSCSCEECPFKGLCDDIEERIRM